jgi:thioredoxin 1
MTILWRLPIGGGIGVTAGALLGYFGKCTSGACPLTASPVRGALYGLGIGLLMAVLATGGCSRRTAADDVPHIDSEEEFTEKVLQADKPVLVDFYADWCGPCQDLAPVIAKLRGEYEGKAHVYKLDVDEHRGLAGRYGASSIPLVVLFHNGQAVTKWRGYNPTAEARYLEDCRSEINALLES